MNLLEKHMHRLRNILLKYKTESLPPLQSSKLTRDQFTKSGIRNPGHEFFDSAK